MKRQIVSIVKYEKPFESVKKAVDLCNGLAHLPPKARVFIKPNILWWTTEGVFPKWGSLTTSRVVEDIVIILKEYHELKFTEIADILNSPTGTVKSLNYRGHEKLKKVLMKYID